MKIQVYSKYRASGVEWLGDVPEHWDVKRLKTSARYRVSNVDKVKNEDEQPVRLCNYTDVYYHDEITPDMALMEGTATLEEIERFHLEVDDIVITKDSEDWRDIAVPARVAGTAPDLVCGYHLAVVTPDPRNLNGRYLLRAFQSCAVNQQFQIAASGVTRYGLPKSSIGEATLPFPPIDEQTAIADFLDRETGRIDTLVAKKQRLTVLLKEKRTALISRTVTRGLPADAAHEFGLESNTRFKDSGIEWLGEVPEDWEVKPLKRVIKFIEGPGIMASDFMDEGVPLLRISCIGGRKANLNGCNYIADDLATSKWAHFRVKINDLLISGSASTGFCSEVDEVTAGAIPYTGIIIIRPFGCALKDFVRWFFLSEYFADQTSLAKTGATIQHFGPSHLAKMVVVLPGMPEQAAIAIYLDRETAKIDRLVQKVGVAIDRLQEYRTALITAAVTGKIDVRGAAA